MEWNGLLGFPLKARCVLMCDLLLCRQMQRHRIASITKCFCFAYNRCALHYQGPLGHATSWHQIKQSIQSCKPGSTNDPQGL